MNLYRAIILVLSAQSIILGVAIMNAFEHPSAITIGALIFVAALLPPSLRNTFKVVGA